MYSVLISSMFASMMLCHLVNRFGTKRIILTEKWSESKRKLTRKWMTFSPSENCKWNFRSRKIFLFIYRNSLIAPTCLVCDLSEALCELCRCHALYNNNTARVRVLLHLEMYHRCPFPWPRWVTPRFCEIPRARHAFLCRMEILFEDNKQQQANNIH